MKQSEERVANKRKLVLSCSHCLMFHLIRLGAVSSKCVQSSLTCGGFTDNAAGMKTQKFDQTDKALKIDDNHGNKHL